MAIPYIMISQLSPPDREGKRNPIYYPRCVYSKRTDIDELARWISKRCTVNPADVVAVLYALGDDLEHRLLQGEKVRLPRIGEFSISVRTGAMPPDQRLTQKQLKGARIRFHPDARLKRCLRNLTFVSKKKK